MKEPRAVVGFDGTPGSRHALRWAISYADRHGLPVHVVTCAAIPVVAVGVEGAFALSPEMIDEAILAAKELNADAQRNCADHGLLVTGEAASGEAVAALLEATGPADTLIVGASRGTGKVAALLGSVATGVVHGAKGAVVVVRTDTVRPTRVVAGVDGSACADHALQWAQAEAVALGAPLLPFTARVSPSPEVNLETECKDSDLLVVGTHGRSALRALLLGSVSRHTVIHAPCSVAVIHGEDCR
jgi:nucleotide-binding universal stress UspA family protein